MNKKLLLIVLVFAFSLAISSANAQLTLTNDVINNNIKAGEFAEYTLTITNDQAVQDTVKLRAVDIKYGQLIFPEGNIAILEPGESKVIPVKFTPPGDVRIGNYALEILAISNENPDIRASTFIRFDILSEGPHLDITIDSEKEVKPGELEINILLKNDGTIYQNNLTGTIDFLNNEDRFDIEPIASDEFKIAFSKTYTIPANYLGNHDLIVKIYQNDVSISEKAQTITVLPREDLKVLTDGSKNLLSFTNTVEITNAGNVPISERFSAPISSLDKHFLSATPLPFLKNTAQGTDLIWTYSLKPGETVSLTYTVSYLPLLLLAILTLAGGFVYHRYFVNPYLVTKEILKDPHSHDALKINIHVKNNTRTASDSVRLVDVVPTPLKLVEEFGTVEPDVVKRKGGGVNMFWDLGGFQPKEDRVISYKVKSSLTVFGRVHVPSAKVRVKAKNKSRIHRSNKVFLKGKVDISEE